MIRRIVNLPFKVLGRMARAVQDRQQASDRERAEALTAQSRQSKRTNRPSLQVPDDFALEDISVSAAEVRALRTPEREVLIVDVRRPEEWSAGHIDGSLNMPLAQLSLDLAELPPQTRFVTVCADGVDSRLAARFLRYRGLDESYYLRNGLSAWED